MPGDARTAQQLQQHRLELIVRVVRRQQYLPFGERRGEGGVTHLARRRFQRLAAPARHLDIAHLQRHPELTRDAPAVCAPARGCSLQVMIDVHARAP